LKKINKMIHRIVFFHVFDERRKNGDERLKTIKKVYLSASSNFRNPDVVQTKMSWFCCVKNLIFT